MFTELSRQNYAFFGAIYESRHKFRQLKTNLAGKIIKWRDYQNRVIFPKPVVKTKACYGADNA